MRSGRPMVNPGLRRVWRDTRTLQFGVDVSRPVVVHDLTAGMAQLVSALDGTLTHSEVSELAHALGLDLDIVDALISRLESQGVIVDGNNWPGSRHLSRRARDRLLADHNAQCLLRGVHDAVRRRERLAQAEVSVHGVGRLGSIICALLTASGIGRVVPVDDERVSATDLSVAGFAWSALGKPRCLITEHTTRWSSVNKESPLRISSRWSVVTNACPSRSIASRLFHQGVPHLVTASAEQWTRVGPLVVPGVTSCLRCFDLNQSERDSAWPTVAAQLDPVPPTVTGDSNLVTATAAIVVMHLLEAIDLKEPPSANGVTFMQMPDGAMVHRAAPSSSQCGCTWGMEGPLPQRPTQADKGDTMVA